MTQDERKIFKSSDGSVVRRVESNRDNAKKSTGPKTMIGKKASSQNALTHGLTAQDVVIKGEDPKQYEMFRQGFLREAVPKGPTETLLVERIIECARRRARK